MRRAGPIALLLPTMIALSAFPTLGAEPGGHNAEIAADAGGLQPFTARYAMLMKGQPWASAVVDLRRARVEGEPAFRHSIALHFRQQTVYDETLFLLEAFRPLMKFIHGGLPPELAYKTYAFQERGLRGANVFADGRAPAEVETVFQGRVFATGTDALVLAASSLVEGLTTTLMSADDEGLHANEVRVERAEQVEVAGRTYRAWVISVRGGKGRVWIAHQAPYLLRQEFPDAGIVWELSEVLRERAWMDDPPPER